LESAVNEHARALLPEKPKKFEITDKAEKILGAIPVVSL
jgi:hypothetical protein